MQTIKASIRPVQRIRGRVRPGSGGGGDSGGRVILSIGEYNRVQTKTTVKTIEEG